MKIVVFGNASASIMISLPSFMPIIFVLNKCYSFLSYVLFQSQNLGHKCAQESPALVTTAILTSDNNSLILFNFYRNTEMICSFTFCSRKHKTVSQINEIFYEIQNPQDQWKIYVKFAYFILKQDHTEEKKTHTHTEAGKTLSVH